MEEKSERSWMANVGNSKTFFSKHFHIAILKKNDHQVLFAFRYCLVLLNMKITCRRYDIWCCTFCSEMSPLKYVFLFALVHLQLL